MRYPVSGANTVAIPPATATDPNRNQSIGVAITSGRIFWLRGLHVRPLKTATDAVIIVDASVGATATTTKLIIAVPPTASVGATPTVPGVLNFGPPGIKFATGIVGTMEATETLAIGDIGCFGYEE